MRSYLLPFLLVLATMIIAPNVYAQDVGTPVEVIATAKDMVGRWLVYGIKEELRKSSGLRLARVDESAGVQLRILTIDSNELNPGISTTYSVVWSVALFHSGVPFPVYLRHFVGYCGTDRVHEAARGTVAITDDITTTSQKYLQTLYEQVNQMNEN